MMTRLLFVVFFLVSYSFAASANCAFFLTGVQLYQTDEFGELKIDIPGQNPTYSNYRYLTNDSVSGAGLRVWDINANNPILSKKIQISLNTGTNELQFEVTSTDAPAQYVGMNLFFEDTDSSPNDNSYNPGTGSIVPGNLTVFVPMNSSNFQKVDGGSNAMNYAFQLSSIPAPANGLNVYSNGVYDVSVSSFLTSTDGAYRPSGLNAAAFGGKFTLTVTATPEPSTIGIGALAFCGLAGWVKKRRGKKLVADRK